MSTKQIDWRGLCEELVRELHGYKISHPHHDCTLIDNARAALAHSESKAELTDKELEEMFSAALLELSGDSLNRAVVSAMRSAITADRARRPAPSPAGMIPVEYWDMDSGARIVSEPSEERPGGCWLVLNSHHISPFIEFSTAEAAWNALQAARALPLPNKEVK